MAHRQILAHCQTPLRAVRMPTLWTELDGRFQQGACMVHSAHARDYRTGLIELRVRLAAGTLSAVWAGSSTLLNPRARVDLIQSAQAWLAAIHDAGQTIEDGYACLEALSPLLSAGFQTVHLVNKPEDPVALVATTDGIQAIAETQHNLAVGEVAFA